MPLTFVIIKTRNSNKCPATSFIKSLAIFLSNCRLISLSKIQKPLRFLICYMIFHFSIFFKRIFLIIFYFKYFPYGLGRSMNLLSFVFLKGYDVLLHFSKHSHQILNIAINVLFHPWGSCCHPTTKRAELHGVWFMSSAVTPLLKLQKCDSISKLKNSLLKAVKVAWTITTWKRVRHTLDKCYSMSKIWQKTAQLLKPGRDEITAIIVFTLLGVGYGGRKEGILSNIQPAQYKLVSA